MSNFTIQKNESTENALVLYKQFLESRLQPAMTYPVNQYGFEVKRLHYDEVVRENRKQMNKMGVCVISSHENGPDGNLVWCKVTQANIGRFFKDYPWDEFVGDFLLLRKHVLVAKVEDSGKESTLGKILTNVKDGGFQFRQREVNLFSNPDFMSKYTKADDDFLFSHLFKDNSGNLYYMLGKELYLLRMADKDNMLMCGNSTDDAFWTVFYNAWKEKFTDWTKKIKLILETWTQESDMSPEQMIMSSQQIPRVFLELIKITIRMRGITDMESNKTSWFYDSLDIALDLPGSQAQWKKQNLVIALSRNLLQSVDISRVKEIPLFSNDENETAIQHLPAYTAFAHEEMPQLPPTWEKFLGNGRFYDPLMDKLKIAHFVDCVMNARYSGRQVLVLCGEGQDGKGTFIDVLPSVVGRDYVVAMNASDFAPEDRFGLHKVFNRKVITLSDCRSVSKLFLADKFKSLTGGDAITLERKNQDQFTYKPVGLCVAIATNNPFYVADEHGKSRAMPCVFRKNFDKSTQFEKQELEQMLISEKQDFLQWCVDYKLWMRTKYPGVVSKANVLTMCTDEDLVNLDTLDEFTLFKHVCEKQLIGTKKACNWNARTEEEEENEDEDMSIWSDFLETCFEYDPESCCTVDDIFAAWNGYIQTRLHLRNSQKTFYPKGQDYKNFRKWLAKRGILFNKDRRRGETRNKWVFQGLKQGCTDMGESMRKLLYGDEQDMTEQEPVVQQNVPKQIPYSPCSDWT